MSEFTDIQMAQEDQYSFPYHYIPQYKNHFSTAVFSGFGINYVSTIEFILKKLNEITFLSICDVGTGDGRLVREISEYFPDREVYGIDYSERAINLAKGFNPSLHFIKANILNEKINQKFDVLTLIEVFEHIPPEQTVQFVDALNDLLNPGGHLLLTVPHINKRLSPKHYQHFDSGKLRTYFNAHFTVEEEVFIEKSRHWRIYFIKRLLKNKFFILNNRKILNRIYKIYKEKCFYTSENNCGRIYLKLKRK